MTSIGEIMFNSINSIKTYKYNNEDYINVKDLISVKEYSKGCNASQDKLIIRKKLTSCIQGRVGLDDETIGLDTIISKKFTKKFVKLSEVLMEFEYLRNGNMNTDTSEREVVRNKWLLHDQRPLIKPDGNEFAFFKDNSGIIHDVEMRGERTKNRIIFKCKDLEKVFEMNRLQDNVLDNNTSFKELEDFLFCKDPHIMGNATDKSLYLTFNGLLKVINNSRTGRAKEFKDYVEDIVFATIVGNVEQREQAAAKVLSIDIKALVKALSKCSGDISCLYLLSTGLKENEKKVYKFGLTKHLHKRINEHIATFGDNIKLITYCIIGDSDLYEAENMFKERASDYFYKSKEDKFSNMKELILLNAESKKLIIERMKLISTKFKYDSKEAINGIRQQVEKGISEYKNTISCMKMEAKYVEELHKKDIDLYKKEIELREEIITSKDKDISMLRQTMELESLRREIAEMKANNN